MKYLVVRIVSINVGGVRSFLSPVPRIQSRGLRQEEGIGIHLIRKKFVLKLSVGGRDKGGELTLDAYIGSHTPLLDTTILHEHTRICSAPSSCYILFLLSHFLNRNISREPLEGQDLAFAHYKSYRVLLCAGVGSRFGV